MDELQPRRAVKTIMKYAPSIRASYKDVMKVLGAARQKEDEARRARELKLKVVRIK